jgi:hypothetical protein
VHFSETPVSESDPIISWDNGLVRKPALRAKLEKVTPMMLSRFAFAAVLLLAGPALADSRSPDLATPLPPIQVPPNHFFIVPTGPAGGLMGSAQYNRPGLFRRR